MAPDPPRSSYLRHSTFAPAARTVHVRQLNHCIRYFQMLPKTLISSLQFRWYVPHVILHNYNVLSHSHIIIWWLGLIVGGGVEIRRRGGGVSIKERVSSFQVPRGLHFWFPHSSANSWNVRTQSLKDILPRLPRPHYSAQSMRFGSRGPRFRLGYLHTSLKCIDRKGLGKRRTGNLLELF